LGTNTKQEVVYINLSQGSGWYERMGDIYHFVADTSFSYEDAVTFAQLQGREGANLQSIDIDVPLSDNVIEVDWLPILPELHLYKSLTKRSFFGDYYHIAVVAPNIEVARVGITQILGDDEPYPIERIVQVEATRQAIYRISAGYLPYSSSDSKYYRLAPNPNWEIQSQTKKDAKRFVFELVEDKYRDVPLGMYRFEDISVLCVDYVERKKYKSVVIVAAGIHEAIQAVRDMFPDKVSELEMLCITDASGGLSESTRRTISYGGMPMMDHHNTWVIVGKNLPDMYEPHVGGGEKYLGLSEKRVECLDPVTGENRVYFTLNRYTQESFSY
jgi:hypothetical protein